MARTHQPGQATFRSILPEDIAWKPLAAFPPSARLAVLVGHPSEPGPYVVRVKVPDGVKPMPHEHPGDASTPSCPASCGQLRRSYAIVREYQRRFGSKTGMQ
jgi:hypothetical protein